MAQKQSLIRRIFIWSGILSVFTLFGCLQGLSSLMAISSYAYVSWVGVMWWEVLNWDLWVPMIPLVIWTARKYRPDTGNWYRAVLIYLFIGILMSIVVTVLLVIISFVTIYGLRALPAFLTYKRFLLFSTLLHGLVVYGLLISFGLARDYYVYYRAGELKSSQLETQLIQAQLRALEMQLQPHFLFNTLNSISALQLEDLPAAQKMMARLGDFLRLTLENSGAQQVALKREMEFLECYLEIQRVRFGPRLVTNVDVDFEVLDAKVPNLILQPIVENSIRHGVSARLARAKIEILARRENGNLLMRVRDNAPPLATNPGRCAVVEGVGLSNTRARLQRLYGNEASLSYENVSEGGLIVSIVIPFETADNIA